MAGLIDTTEMYLRTIVEVSEQGIPPMRARIAERLDQTTPTVSQTVARMERDGLLTLDGGRMIELSAEGLAQARRVLRRHRLAECFLVQVLDLPLADVHDEACRWEHVLTENVERRMWERLGHPTLSPYGCPLPALEELDGYQAEDFLTGAQPVSRAGKGVVVRLSEDAQRDPGNLAALLEAGIVPGAEITIAEAADGFVLTSSAGSVTVDASLAEAVYLRS